MKKISKKVTAKDVAEHAGVSRSLVSMYLSKNPNVWLSTEKKKKIDHAIKELGYKPNYLAQALRKGKTKTLGLVMGGIAARFSGCFGEAIMDEVERQGYRLIIALTKFDIERERLALKNMLDHQVDGIIYTLSTSYNKEFFRPFEKNHCPIVLTEGISEMKMNCTCYDYTKAFTDALLFLNQKGFDKIACLAPAYYQELLDNIQSISSSLSMGVKLIPWQIGSNGRKQMSSELIRGKYNAVISLVDNPNKLFTQAYRPEYIASYYLPLQKDEDALGMICHPFREWVEGIVRLLIDAVENPKHKNQKTSLSCQYRPASEMKEFISAQEKDPYYYPFGQE